MFYLSMFNIGYRRFNILLNMFDIGYLFIQHFTQLCSTFDHQKLKLGKRNVANDNMKSWNVALQMLNLLRWFLVWAYSPWRHLRRRCRGRKKRYTLSSATARGVVAGVHRLTETWRWDLPIHFCRISIGSVFNHSGTERTHARTTITFFFFFYLDCSYLDI